MTRDESSASSELAGAVAGLPRDRTHLLDNPELVYASARNIESACDVEAGSLLSVLVLEADGSLVPISYGMSRDLLICNVKQRRFKEAWDDYLRDGYLRFRGLCREVFEELCAPGQPELFNWHEAIVTRSNAVRRPALLTN